MSFGISVGESIAAEHQELLFELNGLQRALDEIAHLQADPQQETEVNAVKVPALTTHHRLDDLAGKLRRYESVQIMAA
ncbi:hypothetical protein HO173_009036 [Letharia columbiana]|uniref:Uncharacterized protein n=1 Tax=Letharia columbiana TaxID=112416 RepID=A0A8H6L285_9LECA|nr:uncharacterized protein HO173_009036 [Letharia columbiana]KAF6232822.1 hypothetical protein HO173_009036 [Letharia columbiana]